MASRASFEFTPGLSEEEKNDLERLIADFHKARHLQDPGEDQTDLRTQIQALSKQVADLTVLFIKVDQRMNAIYDSIQKLIESNESTHQHPRAILDDLSPENP